MNTAPLDEIEVHFQQDGALSHYVLPAFLIHEFAVHFQQDRTHFHYVLPTRQIDV